MNENENPQWEHARRNEPLAITYTITHARIKWKLQMTKTCNAFGSSSKTACRETSNGNFTGRKADIACNCAVCIGVGKRGAPIFCHRPYGFPLVESILCSMAASVLGRPLIVTVQFPRPVLLRNIIRPVLSSWVVVLEVLARASTVVALLHVPPGSATTSSCEDPAACSN